MTPQTYDIVILGSGAAGLGAAVTAAAHGARVLVLEKASVLGGTTAWSGGWIWAPDTSLARSAGIETAPDAPRRYLQHVLGNHFNPERVDAFLDSAPKMVDFFHTRTALQFDLGAAIPDTYSHLPGAGLGGRSVIARPYDARALKRDIALLRLPLAETTFHGMTIQAGPDLRSFMTMTRSARSFAHVTRRVLRHARDLAFHRRGMDLRNGAALAGRLMQSARDLGVAWRVDSRVSALLRAGGTVTGVQLACGQIIRVRKGVIMATGGYGHDAALRTQTFARNDDHRSLSVPTATGGGAALAIAIGARFDDSAAAPAAYCPVSDVPYPKGERGVFPHIIDRGKPGVIGVLANGARFCNEGLGYHDYVTALLDATPPDHPAQSWLVCDHRFLRRYGLGIVRPAPVPWAHWRKRGYLTTSDTIADLARDCGIDADGLARTVADWNTHASAGHDPAFSRGTTPYMRLQGDPDHGPNPCVAPIVKPPFHAVQVTPGSFGTFAGLACDGAARVLDHAGTPIRGLYCAGADAASPFGGFYPAGGINLGPALTFGFIAGHHAATGHRP
ncbi:MAG: FAD-dependent oxidoreductase [Rhodobacteraceae bacterium]|nr:FAD-dependent oxidoreductase [Paracoccaceae bacterium]